MTQRVLTRTPAHQRAHLPASSDEEDIDEQRQDAGKPEKVKLAQLWVKRVRPWFTLAESTFNRFGVTDSRTRFDLILPALPDDILEQVDSVLTEVEDLEDPYITLKMRVLEICTPDDFAQVNSILFGPELGGSRPSQLMEQMLGLLPPGEKDGLLFQGHFIHRLPSDMRDLVAVHFGKMTSRELAKQADSIWNARNAKKGTRHVAAVSADQHVSDAEEESGASVAAVRGSKPPNQWGRSNQGKKKQQQGDRERANAQVSICYRHKKFGVAAWKCDSPTTCFLATSTKGQGN